MRTVKLALGLSTAIVALLLSSTLAMAGPGAKANGPKAKTTTTKTTTTKTTGASSTKTTKGASAKSTSTKPAKSTTTKPGKTTKAGTTTTTAATSTSSTSTTTTSNTSTSPTNTTTTTTTTWKPTNAVSEKLVTKPNLLQKAKNVLPANTDLNLATAGFKNFGQFNAAVNVSQNLGIDFATLKLKMTGIPLTGTPTGGTTGTTTTTPTTMSLGQAIHDIRGDVDATTEAQKATTQAEIEGGGTTTTTTTTTPSKTKK